MSHIPILFEDGEALIIDKPARLPIDRPRKGGPALIDLYDVLKFGFKRPPAAVHRLDTDTSGCLLLARNPKALKRFCAEFEARTVTKIYHGILDGIPFEKEGRIELSLSKISSKEKGWRMIPAKNGKASATDWRVIATHQGRALVEFRPETGRTHQIRVHAAEGIGIALLHDPVYGTGQGISRTTRTMLHASALIVPRPTKPAVAAHAPLPIDFIGLGFEQPELDLEAAIAEIPPQTTAPINAAPIDPAPAQPSPPTGGDDG